VKILQKVLGGYFLTHTVHMEGHYFYHGFFLSNAVFSSYRMKLNQALSRVRQWARFSKQLS